MIKPPPPPPPRRGRFQFSIFTLLMVMTVVAALSPFLPFVGQFAVPILLLFLLVVPSVGLGAFAVYCRGHRQTFFLGATAASVGILLFYASAVRGAELAAGAVIVMLQLVMCAASGYLAVLVRRFVERSGWDQRDGDDS